MCVCIYEYVCVYSICVCVLSWFFTRTHMHIYPSVRASIRKLNLPAPTLLTLLSRCVLAAKEAAYQTSWPPGQHRMNGLGYVGIPRIVTSQNDAFFWGHDTDTGMCWDNLGQSKWIFHDRGPHLLTCWPQRDGHEFVQRFFGWVLNQWSLKRWENDDYSQ